MNHRAICKTILPDWPSCSRRDLEAELAWRNAGTDWWTRSHSQSETCLWSPESQRASWSRQPCTALHAYLGNLLCFLRGDRNILRFWYMYSCALGLACLVQAHKKPSTLCVQRKPPCAWVFSACNTTVVVPIPTAHVPHFTVTSFFVSFLTPQRLSAV